MTTWVDTSKNATVLTNASKTATTWANPNSSDLRYAYLLQENGYVCLMETGSRLLLEEAQSVNRYWNNYLKS